ncbi:MAG: DUF1365 family protein [Thermodesulfobacteriota bacterium]
MKSRICIGKVTHRRLAPREHSFSYPIYVYALHLSELETLDRTNFLFGHNRFRPVRINDRDYLDHGEGDIRTKLLRHLASRGVTAAIGDIVLVTAARYWNYVFNPVSFYFCHAPGGDPVCVLAEVNNTYGERHLYILTDPLARDTDGCLVFSTPKEFHVSPFNPVDGEYRFRFADIREKLDIQIQLFRRGCMVFFARLSGDFQPLTPLQLLKTLVRYPARPHLSIPRIYREAFRLYFHKKMSFHDKPVPRSPMTIRVLPPTALQRLCMRIILGILRRINSGSLILRMPDGGELRLGPMTAEAARMDIRDYRFFSRTALTGGDIGLGEAYTAGEWDSPDLVKVFKVLIDNRDALADGNFATALFFRLKERSDHVTRRNTLTGSRKNIRDHYDLSNDFYRLFLGDTMVYSCARYQSPEESLEDAQCNKLRNLMEKARIQAGDHVLEIGCGWGSFAIEAARLSGCRVTGITVSKAQHDYAVRRVQEEGLSDQIRILLRDYRRMEGRFDKIVSIEMLEAVGHENFGRFFGVCEQLLKPAGLLVLQTITIPDFQYDQYRRERDWIQKHIFPGGLLPSLTVLSRAMSRHSRFVIEHAENIGIHYARTLADWRRRFLANRESVSRLGFDSTFQRKWNYYLSICQAGFEKRVLGDLQLVLSRPGNPSLPTPFQPEMKDRP